MSSEQPDICEKIASWRLGAFPRRCSLALGLTHKRGSVLIKSTGNCASHQKDVQSAPPHPAPRPNLHNPPPRRSQILRRGGPAAAQSPAADPRAYQSRRRRSENQQIQAPWLEGHVLSKHSFKICPEFFDGPPFKRWSLFNSPPTWGLDLMQL